MPAAPLQVARDELVGAWYDSDVPSSRTRALRLWRAPDGTLTLVTATRETPASQWPASVVVTRNVDRALADAAAATMGLDPYLIRREGVDEATDALYDADRRAGVIA